MSDEEISQNHPDPIMLHLPRLSYLPFFSEKLCKYFAPFLAPDEVGELNTKKLSSSIWFAHNHVPLKWHFPIGFLYDRFHNSTDPCLHLIVHFRNYPSDILLAEPVCLDAIKSNFIMLIKEADQLKHRSRIVEKMHRQNHNLLWYGLEKNKFESFWEVNKLLQDADEQDPNCSVYYIPMRFYLLWRDKNSVIHKLIPPYKESTNSEDRVPTTLSDAIELCQFQDAPENLECIIHGITVPFESSLIWLSKNLSYADNFLHFILRCQ